MGTRWKSRLVLCATVIVGGSVAYGQKSEPLQYHKSDQPHPLVGFFPRKSLDLIFMPPAGLALPDLKSRTARFAKWATPVAPGGFLWIALDRTQPDGPYDRLYIDSNANGRLDDETAVAASSASDSYARFGPVEIAFKDKPKPVTCHLNVSWVQRGGEAPRLSATAGGWYEGAVTVGGTEKTCVLIDQNANGTFDDRSIDFSGCDLIQIGNAGDRDVCLVGRFIQVDGELYRLEVGRYGGHVTLTPAKDVTFGTIKQSNEMVELVAGGENGMLTLKLQNGEGRLPIGTYRVYQWILERKDENGDTWALKAASFGNPDVFEISRGKTRSLALGEPIVSHLDVRQSGRDFVINHSWRGRAGEQVQLTRNGASPPPAAVHIRNADGSYDRSFTFEHG